MPLYSQNARRSRGSASSAPIANVTSEPIRGTPFRFAFISLPGQDSILSIPGATREGRGGEKRGGAARGGVGRGGKICSRRSSCSYIKSDATAQSSLAASQSSRAPAQPTTPTQHHRRQHAVPYAVSSIPSQKSELIRRQKRSIRC